MAPSEEDTIDWEPSGAS